MTDRSADGGFPNGHFYSPVIDPVEVEAAASRIWPPHPEVKGVDFNEQDQRRLLRDVFPKFISDYDYPETVSKGESAPRFFERNPAFAWLDSRALFVLLRHWRPRRLVEVGSGYSTLLSADVNRRFLDRQLEIRCIEPYPMPFLTQGVDGVAEVIRARVQDVPGAVFERLEAGDVLFIDSSHVSKIGSDVNHLFFEVLPRLAKGVHIHFHDVFLPLDYPRDWVLKKGLYWNEAYLLRALLTYTRGYRVTFGSTYVSVNCGVELAEALSGQPCGGGSFWIEKIV